MKLKYNEFFIFLFFVLVNVDDFDNDRYKNYDFERN